MKYLSTRPYEVSQYSGILEHAHPGVHQELADLVRQYVRPGAAVLDIGAGEGAFSRRLMDLGYEVLATDLNESDWKLTTVPFFKFDLNTGLAQNVRRKFDAVCCVEVIEHVENPWALVREIVTILEPGGIAVISTPNVAHFLSRLLFLRTGHLAGFDTEQARSIGHINPIHNYELREIFRSVEVELVEFRPIGYLPVLHWPPGGGLRKVPKLLASNLARACAYAVSLGTKQGWCSAWVIRKNLKPETR